MFFSWLQERGGACWIGYQMVYLVYVVHAHVLTYTTAHSKGTVRWEVGLVHSDPCRFVFSYLPVDAMIQVWVYWFSHDLTCAIQVTIMCRHSVLHFTPFLSLKLDPQNLLKLKWKWGSQRGGSSHVEVGDMIGVADSLQSVTPNVPHADGEPHGS